MYSLRPTIRVLHPFGGLELPTLIVQKAAPLFRFQTNI
jgi:hypothetical protein